MTTHITPKDPSTLQSGPQVLTLEPRRFAAFLRWPLPAVRHRYFGGGGGASVPAVADEFVYPDDILSNPLYLEMFLKNPALEIIGFSTAKDTGIHATATDFAPTVHGSDKPIVRGKRAHCGMPLHMTCVLMTMPLDAAFYLTHMAAHTAKNSEVHALCETDSLDGHTKKREQTFGAAHTLRFLFV